MTIREAFQKGIELLKNADNEAPARDAGALLCFAAGIDRAFLYAHGEELLEGGKAEMYFSLLRRRSGGEPLQYLIGKQEFMSLSFEVGPGVLIPRPETELLVETVLEWCRRERIGPDQARREILDIGTGSGCISVSLAAYLKDCRVTAADIRQEALDTAGRNAVVHSVADRVRFVRSNLFSALRGQRYDVIVSNPPYIRSADIAGLQQEVRSYEPHTALDGGVDGLDFYRAIMQEAPAFLKGNGFLAFETGYDQAQAVADLLQADFDEIRIYKDISGIDRVVTAVYTKFTSNS